ncbi:MAG: hypothetical protein UU77_C0008G0022 [candidate division WWE3 bacterium GW2011_GWC1_41_7]|uniref:Uncharacterized protein n=1 Tax=candidate division WWE3 bacterium GW2011_GWC1_41_7 TaxID=1619119 RepID=A0A0G0X866_UNCKA|nr:MAG: hypothetical protein UU77_C0008G0022 [candidate division WWE3 bacterium GW2011_GWC1_41_7]
MEKYTRKKIVRLITNKHVISLLIYLFISLILGYLFTHKLVGNQFLMVGDQYITFTLEKSVNELIFVRKIENMGVHNAWQSVIHFWDSLFFVLAYSFGWSGAFTERMIYTLTLFTTLALSYIGFNKLKGITDMNVSHLSLYAVNFWYVFNPYTFTLWHGGVFGLGLAVTYALAPLIFFYTHKIITTKFDTSSVVILAILLFLSSFVFWLFAPLVFFLVTYTLFFVITKKGRLMWLDLLKSITLLGPLLLFVASMVFFAIVFEYFGKTGYRNPFIVRSFENQQGGLWYMVLMYFSWAIYTDWTPRILYPFGNYFFTKNYIFSTLALYFTIVYGLTLVVYKRLKTNNRVRVLSELIKENAVLFSLFLTLFVSIFFAKASQPPFGGLFGFMFDHVPLFSVFRSADARFGFCVVLSVALLLIFVSKFINKYVFAYLLFAIVFNQSILLLSGEAVYGRNVENRYIDRIVYLPKAYQDLIDFFNSDTQESGYIFPLPPVSYGHYNFDYNEIHIGQDLIQKFIQRPFWYSSLEATGSSLSSYNKVDTAIKQKDIKTLEELPIKYILFRNDAICKNCRFVSEEDLNGKLELVFKNEVFSVYEFKNRKSIVYSDNSEFKMVNPIKFRVSLKNIKGRVPLLLNLSYNPHWKLYINGYSNKINCVNNNWIFLSNNGECVDSTKVFEGEELSYLWRKPIFEESHKASSEIVNKWEVDSDYIKANYDTSFYNENEDGSVDINLVIYYQPQSWFYLTIAVSFATMFALLLYILVTARIKQNA